MTLVANAAVVPSRPPSLSRAACRLLATVLPERFAVPRSREGERDLLARTSGILDAAAQGIEDGILKGPGLVIFSLAEPDAFTEGQLAGISYALGLLLGRPVAQNANGERMALVADSRPADVGKARGYLTNEAMLLHTDPSSVVTLTCLRESEAGGASLFASAAAIHDAIANAHPDLIETCHGMFCWEVRNLCTPGSLGVLASPIFDRFEDRLFCRFGSSLLSRGLAVDKSRSPAKRDAIQAFEDATRRQELQFRHKLRKGESVWANNHMVLHGREAFRDSSHPQLRRRYARGWIRLHNAVPMSSRFAEFDELLLSPYEAVPAPQTVF